MTLGGAFYVLAALADIHLTLAGMNGDLSLEGNAVMRALMERVGIAEGLWLGKAAVGLACCALAGVGEPDIRRGAAWIDKVPSTPWARAWIAYVPLYGTACFQLLAALSWLALPRP